MNEGKKFSTQISEWNWYLKLRKCFALVKTDWIYIATNIYKNGYTDLSVLQPITHILDVDKSIIKLF